MSKSTVNKVVNNNKNHNEKRTTEIDIFRTALFESYQHPITK